MTTPHRRGAERRATTLLLTALVLGAALRLWLVVQPPPAPLLWDHHEYVCWSAQQVREGVLSLYEGLPPELSMWVARQGRRMHAPAHVETTRVCNYPPLSTYLFYLEGRALLSAQGELVSNTRAARTIYALPSMLADVLLAAGCWAIVRQRAGRWAAAIGSAVIFCAPPILIDSARWGQTDSWVLAPAAWMLWLMMRRRWLWAGALWGLALALKTQAILLAPIWLFSLIVARDRRRQVLGTTVAVAVLFAVALPFTLTSGLAWFEKSYSENLLQAYKQTTLKAFNIWYLDLLICEDDDASVKLLGLEKDLWGKILVASGVLVGGWLVAHRRRDPGEKLLFFAGLMLLCAVVLPTRVHERYIVLPLPFLVCAAAARRRLWWGVVPLIIAAGFQISSMEWIKKGAQGWGYVRERTYEQYERYRRELPPEQFAGLEPPEELLARDRPRFVQERWASGTPPKEWALTAFEVASAGTCLVLLCGRQGPRGGPTANHGPARASARRA